MVGQEIGRVILIFGWHELLYMGGSVDALTCYIVSQTRQNWAIGWFSVS